MDESLIKKLEEIQEALNVLEVELSSGEISQDPNLLADKAKKHSELSEISTLFKEWRKLSKDISEAKVMLEEEEDDEMIKDLNLLLDESIIKSDEIVSQIKVSLLPKDPLDEKDVLVEIRPGTGGEEASIWVSDLFKMYTRYSERMDWKFETLEMIPSDMGGYSKVVFAIKSKGAYSKLKYEAGAHRVQRVPKTESQGRVHTSISTVAVLPEAEDVDIKIDQIDIKVDVYRSSGPGGQSVNTTDSAVRITHIPTGLVVTSQDEKSQLKNKNQAMRILRARLLKAEEDRAHDERAKDRKEQVGSGERSDKIRTYNYKDNRVTDHRIHLTLNKLDQVLDGDLEDFTQALIADNESKRLTDLKS